MSKQRYEREIEEILRKYEEEKARKGTPATGRERGADRDRSSSGGGPEPQLPIGFRSSKPVAPPPRKPGFTMPDLRRLTAGQYIMLAFAVALLAIFLRGLGDIVTFVLIILSVILFLVPIFTYNGGRGSTTSGFGPREEKRWRGQVIDINTRREVGGDPLAGIKRWFKRR